MPASINESLNFLDQYRQADLEELRREFPEHSKLLTPNLAGIGDPAIHVRVTVALKAARHLAPVALRALAAATKRVREAERIEDWATSATAISASLTAIAALTAFSDGLKIGAALLTLVSSLASLMARRRKRALFAKDITDQARVLSDAAVNAQTLASDLSGYLDPTTPNMDEAAVKAVEQTNALLKTVNLALVELRL